MRSIVVVATRVDVVLFTVNRPTEEETLCVWLPPSASGAPEIRSAQVGDAMWSHVERAVTKFVLGDLTQMMQDHPLSNS